VGRVATSLTFRPAIIVALIVLVAPALAALDSVADLFGAGQYPEARQALLRSTDGARPGEEAIWRCRLTEDPDEALVLLREALDDRGLPEIARLRMALEVADLEFARGHYREVLAALAEILNEESGELPGEVYLRAGLALRGLGDLQRAREMLASVRPHDPSFSLARYYLGDIGLDQNDPALALRYFDSAADGGDREIWPRLAAGRWRALRNADDQHGAAQILERLEQEYSGSLALLEIRRILREEADEMAARAVPAPADTVATQPEDSSGRYTIQLGAFSDRALALAFVERFVTQCPTLRVDQVQDDRGQYLYKVRTGRFINPALARTEAQRLERLLGIETIIADLSR